MATFDEILKQAQQRDAQNKAARQSLTPVSPAEIARRKVKNSIPETSFQSVLDEYNTSLPGIGRRYASTLSKERKQEMVQGTQRFFEEAPTQDMPNNQKEDHYSNVKRLLRQRTVPSSQVALIKQYNVTGTITDEQAIALLSEYGLPTP